MSLRTLGLDGTIRVTIDTTSGWYRLHDCLEDEGFDAKLSRSLKAGAMACAGVKTGQLDSALS